MSSSDFRRNIYIFTSAIATHISDCGSLGLIVIRKRGSSVDSRRHVPSVSVCRVGYRGECGGSQLNIYSLDSGVNRAIDYASLCLETMME